MAVSACDGDARRQKDDFQATKIYAWNYEKNSSGFLVLIWRLASK